MIEVTEHNVPEQDRRALRRISRRYSGDPVRSCGSCTACCDMLAIPEHGKPMNTPCAHSCSSGCAIYAARPDSCQSFKCAWLMGYGKHDDRPDKCGALADYRHDRLGWKLYGLIFNPGEEAVASLERISLSAGVDVLVVG